MSRRISAKQASRKDLSASAISTLVEIVGRSAAITALVRSDIVNVQQLSDLAKRLNIVIPAKTQKNRLAEEIVLKVDRRITKPLSELRTMERDVLLNYLRATSCSTDELLSLLKEANIPVQSSRKSRSELIEFAATQITDLGVYERITSGGSRNSRPTSQPEFVGTRAAVDT